MQILLITASFGAYFLIEVFHETIAETSANYYYDHFGALFWGVPKHSAEELSLMAITGPEVEYLHQICSMPFL